MNWYRFLLWFIGFLFFLCEGTIVPWLIPDFAADMQLVVTSRMAFIWFLYIAIYLQRSTAIAMALAFGLLHDLIFYGHMLGVHAFGMVLCTYLIALMLRDTHVTWYTGIASIGLGLIAFDMIKYGLYRLFQVTEADPWWHVVHNIVPSLSLNLLFALAIYYPVIKSFARIEKHIAPVEPDEIQPSGHNWKESRNS